MLAYFLAFGCANEWQALDADGDGWTVGAGDCWDETALHGGLEGSQIHPEAPDVPYDGVDADCAGDDDFDHDGDGYVTSIWTDAVTEGIPSTLPGGDCWDDRDEIEQEFGALPGFPQLAAADVHPGPDETWYDGIDQNCDGGDDFDQDGDGHASAFHRDGASALGDDCFDAIEDPFENPKGLTPPQVHPTATDECYDYTDADCDGASDWDCDGDGFLEDADCDDLDPNARPGASEIWYDGIDQDCDWNDGDKDHDGFLAADYTGKVKAPGIDEGDCWDDPDDILESKNGLPQLQPQDVHPFAIETWYDGINQDCDDPQDFDKDFDGYDAEGMDGSTGSPDCVDTDAAINPAADETCATPYDDNCVDGNNDTGALGCQSYFYDEDGDGHGAIGIPAECRCGSSPWDATDADDCDDSADWVYEGAPEIVDNGTDDDCDGIELCYLDADGDSFRPDSSTLDSADLDCTDAGEGSALDGDGDCDDTLDTINPAATEICDNGIDENCDASSAGCALIGSSVAVDMESDASLVGETGFGYAIAAGELDGVGPADVLITANLTLTVYGFLGPLSALDVPTSDRAFQIASTVTGFGESLAANGDLDDDGVNDVAIGNPFADTTATNAGAAFVFFGPLSGAYTEAADANVVLEGESGDDQLGVSLATGDWNDDGTDDLAIGANSQDAPSANRAGALWVFFGPLSDGDSLPDDADATREGESADDHATRSLAAGDLNGDGFDDIAVGVPGSDSSGLTESGGVYVVFGPVTGDASFATSDSELYGDRPGAAAGTAVGVGDFDGTGSLDLVVGAPGAAVAYLVTSEQLSSPEFELADASGMVDGPVGGLAGTAVGSAGDFDNDGRADLFVGAPGNVHLAVFYVPPSGAVGLADGDLVLQGTKGDDLGFAARSLGDQDGDDIDELIVGAPAETSGGTGTAWILLGAGM